MLAGMLSHRSHRVQMRFLVSTFLDQDFSWIYLEVYVMVDEEKSYPNPSWLGRDCHILRISKIHARTSHIHPWPLPYAIVPYEHIR